MEGGPWNRTQTLLMKTNCRSGTWNCPWKETKPADEKAGTRFKRLYMLYLAELITVSKITDTPLPVMARKNMMWDYVIPATIEWETRSMAIRGTPRGHAISLPSTGTLEVRSFMTKPCMSGNTGQTEAAPYTLNVDCYITCVRSILHNHCLIRSKTFCPIRIRRPFFMFSV